MATLHLMVGLPCAGKTTRAKLLEKELNALRLTPDEWQLRLFGQDAEAPEHDWRHDTIEDLMWRTAATVLGHGVDVILDYGFWKKIERDDYRARAAGIGARCRIHLLDVAEDILLRRLDIRNETGDPTSFRMSRAQLSAWLSHFECPSSEELEAFDA